MNPHYRRSHGSTGISPSYQLFLHIHSVWAKRVILAKCWYKHYDENICALVTYEYYICDIAISSFIAFSLSLYIALSLYFAVHSLIIFTVDLFCSNTLSKREEKH